MKCLACNNEWADIKGVLFPVKCPFCGEISVKKANVLRYIKTEYGNKVLDNISKFSTLVNDLLFDDKNLAKTLIIIQRNSFHLSLVDVCKMR